MLKLIFHADSDPVQKTFPQIRPLGPAVLARLLVEHPSYTTNEVRHLPVGLRVLRLERGLFLGELDLCL